MKVFIRYERLLGGDWGGEIALEETLEFTSKSAMIKHIRETKKKLSLEGVYREVMQNDGTWIGKDIIKYYYWEVK